MDEDGHDALDRARLDCGLTGPELWMRYFALGGSTGQQHLEAVLHGAPVAADHDQIARALNERFTELGSNHQMPYRNLERS